MKTTKSLTKRIKITRTGKLIRRPMATDHFRTSKSKKLRKKKLKTLGLNYPRKTILNY